MGKGKLIDWFKGNIPAKVATDLVVGTADGVANIVDRFVQNPQERAELQLELERFKLQRKEMAMEADAAVLADRQSARQMAGIHGKLQTAFALTFLAGFLALLVGEIVFLGWLVSRWLEGAPTMPEWLQVLISTTLTGVISYMASMLKEVVGFLFGGSAGGDDREAALHETLRTATSARPPEEK